MALVGTLLIVMLFMSILWLVSLKLRDASIIDPFWGLGFVLIVWTLAAWKSPIEPRHWLLAALTTLWGVRLAGYLFRRRRGHGEDRRYAAMRQRHGSSFGWISLWTVFWLQSIVLWFVSLPLQVAMLNREQPGWTWLDFLGLSVWLIGFLFETFGDWQLAKFIADPANRGRVLDRGLWRYTRHPNYFGDFCVWWGLYLIAAVGGGMWMIASPLAMSYLLLRVSGVGLLESTIRERRPEYAKYQARTSAFFPWPPRED